MKREEYVLDHLKGLSKDGFEEVVEADGRHVIDMHLDFDNPRSSPSVITFDEDWNLQTFMLRLPKLKTMTPQKLAQTRVDNLIWEVGFNKDIYSHVKGREPHIKYNKDRNMYEMTFYELKTILPSLIAMVDSSYMFE